MAWEVYGITFFTLVSYVSGYIAALIVATCMATSLFYLSDVCEDNPSTTRYVIRNFTYAVIAVQVMLYVADDFPFVRIAFGVLTHAAYMQQLSPAFPEVVPGPKFYAAIALFVCDNVSWYYYFAENWSYSSMEVFGFCLSCVWFVPIALFISLQIAGTNSLPTSDAAIASGGAGSASAAADGPHSAGSGGGFSLKRFLHSILPVSRGGKHSILPTQSPKGGDDDSHHSHSSGGGSGGAGGGDGSSVPLIGLIPSAGKDS